MAFVYDEHNPPNSREGFTPACAYIPHMGACMSCLSKMNIYLAVSHVPPSQNAQYSYSDEKMSVHSEIFKENID